MLHMIRKENLEEMIESIGYTQSTRAKVYVKKFAQFNCTIAVDFNGSGSINYPEDKGMKITRKTTCNFSQPENFVVLECITRLMDKGYRPEHIELEKEWTLGHSDKSGFADILVKDTDGKTLFIIECKTPGTEYKKELNNTLNDGGQLFSYWKQEGACKWLSLYTSDFDGTTVSYTTETIDCSDDANILATAKKDPSILLYRNAGTTEDLFTVWDETYDKRVCGDVIFRDDSQAYQIGVKPLRKIDLKDFSENDKVVNKFEEILRHNNVSDKENAFNRLIALFICKLVDEMQKGDNDIVDFQYKIGTDTYESLQDRLQRLHKEGMEKFMHEEIFYVADDYPEKLVQQYTGQNRQKMIEDLRNTLRILKFYTNNDFAFKDVHNEELFYQNGKILVEIVQLFENYRIIGSNDVQMLGDLFEQLLNKGFKQNEGQFFTPIPITRFIWDSLPIERIIQKANGIEFPKIIDYACGAGHFLTQGFEAINDSVLTIDPTYEIDSHWTEHKIYGIEKDYRLARVSKISLFMHGAGNGNIIFGDGLENYIDKDIKPSSFDILVANPPYSVRSFKPHLKLKDNEFSLLESISNDGSEIETLFVERMAQLVKPSGIAAVILPVTILNKEVESYIKARESILKNFKIRSIVQLGSKTFSATGQNTIVLFLEKFSEPPKRIDMISDSIDSILNARNLSGWEDNDILNAYLEKINVAKEDYYSIITSEYDFSHWKDNSYFSSYVASFEKSSIITTKLKQKSFKKLPAKEQSEWINQKFVEYIISSEREKLIYFACVYNQLVLVIQSPDDNKKQEKFLGYKWSNRKGSEGIQIIEPGGLLYDDTNRNSDSTISYLIRNSFYDNTVDCGVLESYTHYIKLSDMIDFRGVTFNKIIKTTKIRVKTPKSGYTLYSLANKTFTVELGDRVVADEQLVKDGTIPVYSANVFEPFGLINKNNITDFNCDSVIWGIDGDWMVNVIKANTPFYPTDHCGVLRTKNPDIIPEYLALALEKEGRYEHFSRSNRASIQRIRALELLIPDKAKQAQLLKKIEQINFNQKIQREIISKCQKEIREKFIELFGNIINFEAATTITKIGDIATVTKLAGFEYTEYIHYKNSGDIIMIRGLNCKGTRLVLDDIYWIDKETSDLLPRSQLHKGDVLMTYVGTVGEIALIDEDNKYHLAPNVAKITLNDDKTISATFLAFLLYYMRDRIVSTMQSSALSMRKIRDIEICLPPTDKQFEFEKFVNSLSNTRNNAEQELKILTSQRNKFIDEEIE